MKSYHYLASANSCQGFKNCFNNINPNKNSFTYILKGGPGTGKSTLMKRFGKIASEKGFDVEYFYCSSDSDSLDGVKVRELNVAIVDGTAPHITEASEPGIKEKILNVGEFIGEDVKIHKSTIEKLLEKKSKCFELAFSYLQAVGKIVETEKLEHENNLINSSKETNKSSLKDTIEKLKLTPQKKTSNEVYTRHLFSTFIDKGGVQQIYDKNTYDKTLVLEGSIWETSILLKKLGLELEKNNYHHIQLISLFDPNLIEAIYVEELNTLILGHDYNKLVAFKNKSAIYSLLKRAGYYVSKAREYHKKVEKFYVSCMDFKKLNEYFDGVVSHNF